MKIIISLFLCFSFTASLAEKPKQLSEQESILLHDAAMDILGSSKCRKLFREYINKNSLAKAFAYTVDPRGYYGQCNSSVSTELKKAEDKALKACNKKRNKDKYIKKFSPVCKLFASNNKLLLGMADYKLKPQQLTLIYAAQRKSIATIKTLIDKGADIEQTDKFNSTPLTKAIWEDRKDVVEYLISQKANIKHQGNKGQTALAIAALKGNADIFDMLLDNGADINFVEEKTGKALLHVAAERGNRNIIKRLLTEKLDINQDDNYQMTPLHYAVSGRKFKTVKLLVESGADVNAKSKTGSTPLDFAINKKKKRIAGYLNSKGAKPNKYKQK